MSYNPKLVGKTGGLGNSVFKCSFVNTSPTAQAEMPTARTSPRSSYRTNPPRCTQTSTTTDYTKNLTPNYRK